jgi:hypothetical protein
MEQPGRLGVCGEGWGYAGTSGRYSVVKVQVRLKIEGCAGALRWKRLNGGTFEGCQVCRLERF